MPEDEPLFTIKIVDPCKPPRSLDPPAQLFGNVHVEEYTIAAGQKTFQLEPFMPDPSWCEVSYTYEI